MEENETLDAEIDSGANEGESPDASSESGETGEPAKAAAPKQEESTPFHEHPRFKELVEQKNHALAAQRSLEQKLAQLETRFSQPQQPTAPSKEQTDVDALISDLQKIDPRLAAQIQAMTQAQTTIQKLQERLDASEKSQAERERQATIQTTVSKINQLHESNKASPELRDIINAKLDNLYMSGKLNAQNVDQEYKNVLDGFNKYLESVKRAERESYVADKKKDASVPTSQPKGQPAKASPKKPTWSKDPEIARQQIVNRFLKQQSANKEADSV